MSSSRTATGVVGGLAVALLLHALGGVGAVTGLAQPPTNGTVTESTTSSTSFESPPVCSAVGSSRQVQTLTSQLAVGPACIGIGNRDIVNPAPACAGLPPGLPDPGRGTTALVQFGTSNTNFNLHTETIQCVAAVPALPLPLLLGLGGALAGLGAYGARRLKGRSA